MIHDKFLNTLILYQYVRVHTDRIMEEYHKRRAVEHFPTQYFIDEKYLDISRVAFSRTYHSWRKTNNQDIFLISTDMYLQWLSTHFNQSLDPLISYWNNVRKRTLNGNLSSSLITAMSIFSIFYPNIPLNIVCGGSRTTLVKHVKFLESIVNDGNEAKKLNIQSIS